MNSGPLTANLSRKDGTIQSYRYLKKSKLHLELENYCQTYTISFNELNSGILEAIDSPSNIFSN
jgi:hypothetical protein